MLKVKGERFQTLVEMFELTCDAHAARPAIGTKRADGWTWTSYSELRGLVDRLRGGLSTLGVGAGDRVAIISNNRLEWAVAAYATYGLEAAVVPLYEAQGRDERAFILRDSGAKVAIAATRAIAIELRDARRSIPTLTHVVTLDVLEEREPSYAGLLALGARTPVAARRPAQDASAALIYTSGTTGEPKGVLLSHGNITSNINAVHELFDFSQEDRSLAFIPWAHTFGQTCELHTMLSLGASIGINDRLARLPADFLEVRPTILVAVPSIFNRIFANVQAQLAERAPVVRRLFEAGVRSAKQRSRGELRAVDRAAHILADALIFRKIRRRFGGKLKYAISGGASLAKEVAELIEALGITVYEGYGLTETSPMVTANCPGHTRIGTVGRLLPGVAVRIERDVRLGERDGEIVVFGPNVMKGYHNRPADQEKAFTPDGGLRTGDLGYMDNDGFLHVTGRIKEQYKLQNGKYVAPAPLEEALKLSPYIANAMVHGADRPYNVAVVVANTGALERWARAQGISIDKLDADPRVHELVAREIAARSAAFKAFERPRDFLITTVDFTVENDLLTPTLKLKRKNVLLRYGHALEALYRDATAA